MLLQFCKDLGCHCIGIRQAPADFLMCVYLVVIFISLVINHRTHDMCGGNTRRKNITNSLRKEDNVNF